MSLLSAPAMTLYLLVAALGYTGYVAHWGYSKGYAAHARAVSSNTDGANDRITALEDDLARVTAQNEALRNKALGGALAALEAAGPAAPSQPQNAACALPVGVLERLNTIR